MIKDKRQKARIIIENWSTLIKRSFGTLDPVHYDTPKDFAYIDSLIVNNHKTNILYQRCKNIKNFLGTVGKNLSDSIKEAVPFKYQMIFILILSSLEHLSNLCH